MVEMTEGHLAKVRLYPQGAVIFGLVWSSGPKKEKGP